MAVAIIIAASIRWVDYPVAAMLLKTSKQGATAGTLLSGRNIVAGEMLVIVALALTHLWNGALPKWANTMLVACSASVMAYTLNDTILKAVFGRSNPAAFYHDHAGKFHLFGGDHLSSFPSGHMMLASAFLAVAFRAYSRTRIAIALLLPLGCVVLVLGDWHYVSDVLAGAFLGFTAGLITAELWAKDTAAAA